MAKLWRTFHSFILFLFFIIMRTIVSDFLLPLDTCYRAALISVIVIAASAAAVY